jgi:hypothetical protein
MKTNEIITLFFKHYYNNDQQRWSNYDFETLIVDYAESCYDERKCPSTFRRVKDEMLRNTKSREVLNRKGFDIKVKSKGKYAEYRIIRYRGKKYWEQND